MKTEFATCPLGTVAEVRSGFAFKSKDWLDFGIPVVKIANVKDGRLEMEGCSFVAPEVATAANEYRLRRGDILIAMTGYIGDVALIRDDNHRMLNQRVGRFNITAPEKLDARYLFYFLRCGEIRQEIEGLGYGSAQPNVSPSLIHGVEIPLPQLDEQVAIAAMLGSLDDKIELNRRMNRTLEQLAAAIFKAWFVDFEPVKAKAAGATRFPSMPQPVFDALPTEFTDSPLGSIPKGWRVLTVSDIAELNGWTLDKQDELGFIQYVEISEVMRGDVNKLSEYERGAEPSRARRRLRHGDTVMSTVRPDRGAYFLCLHPTPHLIASTGFVTLTPTKAPWSFVHAATARNEVLDELGRLADGGAYPAIRPEVVGALELVVPASKAVLDGFHEVVAPLYEKTHSNRNESKTLADIRDALLPKLLSGEIRVGAAEKLVGEVA